MQRMLLRVIALAWCTFAINAYAGPRTWLEGTNYVQLDQVQQTHVAAGRVEVLEVFSYGCPACNAFQPLIEKLERSLPANAQMVFLPASFSTAEDMPMFQRAFFAAQSLGVAAQAHQAIFDAVWKTGELAVVDPDTGRLRSRLPTLEDAARCYARLTGVKQDDFLKAAGSFGVATQMRVADTQVVSMRVPGTPCLIVNGKYRVELGSLKSRDDVIDVVKFLVGKESQLH
jgi:protein dithiol oxidoreductase (disulfide-forming)